MNDSCLPVKLIHMCDFEIISFQKVNSVKVKPMRVQSSRAIANEEKKKSDNHLHANSQPTLAECIQLNHFCFASFFYHFIFDERHFASPSFFSFMNGKKIIIHHLKRFRNQI